MAWRVVPASANWPRQLAELVVGGAALQDDDASADRRAHDIDWQNFADAAGEADPVQPGHGQDDGVEVAFVEPGEAGVGVATQGGDGQVGEAQPDLRGAAHAAGADDRALGQIRQTRAGAGDGGVADVFAGEVGGERGSRGGWHIAGNVLEAVHGEVDLLVEQGTVDLADERSLATELGEVTQPHVPTRGDLDKFDADVGVLGVQVGGDLLGLVHRHRAGAGADFDQTRHERTLRVSNGRPRPGRWTR